MDRGTNGQPRLMERLSSIWCIYYKAPVKIEVIAHYSRNLGHINKRLCVPRVAVLFSAWEVLLHPLGGGPNRSFLCLVVNKYHLNISIRLMAFIFEYL